YEPEGAVDGVVFEGACVGRVREHPFGDRGRGGAENLAPLAGAVRAQVEPLVRRHQVTRPLTEPRVAGDGSRSSVGRDRELVGRQYELSVDGVGSFGATLELRRPCPGRRHEPARRWQVSRNRRGRRGQLVGSAGGEVDAEPARGPDVLGVVQPSGRFLTGPHAAIPLASRLPAGPGDPVCPLQDHAGGRGFDAGRAVPEALAVDAPPRAEGGQLEAHGTVGADDAMDDPYRGTPVRECDLALDDDVADLPTPARYAVLEVEADEKLVTAGVHHAAGPLVGRKL